MERTLERKSLNGFTYQFVEWMLFGKPTVSTYFDGRCRPCPQAGVQARGNPG